MDDNSHKAPNLEFASLDPHIQEIIEVWPQA